MQLVPILDEHLSLEQDDNEGKSTPSPYSPLILKANTKQCEKRIWLLSLRAFFGDLSASVIAGDINNFSNNIPTYSFFCPEFRHSLTQIVGPPRLGLNTNFDSFHR